MNFTSIPFAIFFGVLLALYALSPPRFRKLVLPGDQLRIEVNVLAWRRTTVRMEGKAFVGVKLACEAVVSCQLIDRPGSSGAQEAMQPAEAEGIAQP